MGSEGRADAQRGSFVGEPMNQTRHIWSITVSNSINKVNRGVAKMQETMNTDEIHINVGRRLRPCFSALRSRVRFANLQTISALRGRRSPRLPKRRRASQMYHLYVTDDQIRRRLLYCSIHIRLMGNSCMRRAVNVRGVVSQRAPAYDIITSKICAGRPNQSERSQTTASFASSIPMEDKTFDPDLIHAIFKLVWSRRALEGEKNEGADAWGCEIGGGSGTSKRTRFSSANGKALKLSCELLRIFVTEGVQRAATIAEAEGVSKIEATHLERILPQLLLDF
ncbi:hypothetical protein FNV43_RR21419 [Rhamnella rubrinervis]|uniref:Centromere protein X n=1 Tax=Rhamnella rubrinervis TaxID=2594499 RepID=A0A8K0GXQ2_9ROSA|nr:hypothetical protein FNV43_RR21419 [Rhamnella rubrinervis]